MFHAGQCLTLGSPVAVPRVSQAHARHIRQALEELPDELLCRERMPATLPQAIQDIAVLSHRPPAIVPFAADGAEDGVQMPFGPRPRPPPELLGVLVAQFATPFAERFV